VVRNCIQIVSITTFFLFALLLSFLSQVGVHIKSPSREFA
jgi:hypothetical protein